MKKKDIAKLIGITTRQHLDYVLAGKKNFSFEIAKNATEHIGGSLEIWMDPTRATERMDVFREFRERKHCKP